MDYSVTATHSLQHIENLFFMPLIALHRWKRWWGMWKKSVGKKMAAT